MKKFSYPVIAFFIALLIFPSIALAFEPLSAVLFTLTGGAAVTLFGAILVVYINTGGSGCWFCPIFTSAFDTINEIATTLFQRLSISFMPFLAIGGALWILFIVLRYVTTLNVPNTGALIQSLFNVLWRVAVASIILTTPFTLRSASIFDYTINPVISFTGGLSSEILNAAGLGNGYVIERNKNDEEKKHELCVPSSVSDPRFFQNTFGNYFKRKALNQDAYDSMLCMLRKMSLELIFGIGMGSTFIISAFTTNSSLFFIPDSSLLISGFVIFFSYFAMFIMFPFKLIDILIRLGFVISLTPLFVLFWTFPITREYVKRGWDMFISSMFTLIALSILMVIAIRLLSQPVAGGNIQTVVKLLAEGNVSEAGAILSIRGTSLFIIFIAAFLSIRIISMAPAFGALFGGASINNTLGNALWETTSGTIKTIYKNRNIGRNLYSSLKLRKGGNINSAPNLDSKSSRRFPRRPSGGFGPAGTRNLDTPPSTPPTKPSNLSETTPPSVSPTVGSTISLTPPPSISPSVSPSLYSSRNAARSRKNGRLHEMRRNNLSSASLSHNLSSRNKRKKK